MNHYGDGDLNMHDIISAFYWDNTPEGIAFWMKINDEFENFND